MVGAAAGRGREGVCAGARVTRGLLACAAFRGGGGCTEVRRGDTDGGVGSENGGYGSCDGSGGARRRGERRLAVVAGWRKFGPAGARDELGRQWQRRAAGWWKEVAANGMARWSQGGTCSGLLPAEVGPQVVVIHEKGRSVGVRVRKRMALERKGLQPSQQGRWAAVGVMDVRVTKTGGVLALVRWCGEWADTWEALRTCSPALRAEAKVMLAAAAVVRKTRHAERAAATRGAAARRELTAHRGREARSASVASHRLWRTSLRRREPVRTYGWSQLEWVQKALRCVGSDTLPSPSCADALLEVAWAQLRGGMEPGWLVQEAREVRDRLLLARAVLGGTTPPRKGAGALWGEEAAQMWEALPASVDRGKAWVWAAHRAAGRAWGGTEEAVFEGVCMRLEGDEDSSERQAKVACRVPAAGRSGQSHGVGTGTGVSYNFGGEAGRLQRAGRGVGPARTGGAAGRARHGQGVLPQRGNAGRAGDVGGA